MPRLILASTSPTRRKLLQAAGIAHEASQAQCDEEQAKQDYKGAPTHLALHLAKAKALSLAANATDLILAADQTLLCNGQLFNKPRSRDEARHQLLALRGQSHGLRSALAIACNREIIWTNVSEAHLTMRNFTDEFLDHYLRTQHHEVLASVGCYRIEEHGIQLFDHVDGSHDVIMGLPLIPLLNFLRQQGMITP